MGNISAGHELISRAAKKNVYGWFKSNYST